MKVIATVITVFLPGLAWAQGAATGGTPEIPAGAAPIIVAGIAGAVLLIRNRSKKAKKD